MNHVKGLIILLACLFCLLPADLSAQYEIEARVDKNEVGFGDSLTLVISITQRMTNGGSVRSVTPDIGEIPGFDIASTRTGHSTSWVNGAGMTQSQVVYELVPREPGKKTIPSFSFKDPDGKVHSTEAIEINVLPPEEKEPQPEETAVSDSGEEAGSSGILILLLAGVVVFFVLLSLPFIISVLIGRKSEQRSENIEDAEIVTESLNEKPEPVKEKRPEIDFAAELASLKRRNPEVDGEFYRQFFALFKQAAVQRGAGLSDDLTPDEMLTRIRAMNSGEALKQAAIRLGVDMEMVLYAGGMPTRNFNAVEEDVRTVLNGID